MTNCRQTIRKRTYDFYLYALSHRTLGVCYLTMISSYGQDLILPNVLAYVLVVFGIGFCVTDDP
jgi:hypothetical protein